MKEILQLIVEKLVSKPEAVQIKKTQDSTRSILEVRIAQEDVGRVIGKQDRTVQSIRCF